MVMWSRIVINPGIEEVVEHVYRLVEGVIEVPSLDILKDMTEDGERVTVTSKGITVSLAKTNGVFDWVDLDWEDNSEGKRIADRISNSEFLYSVYDQGDLFIGFSDGMTFTIQEY
jgi:hypothetical protein